jgi:hypothetical protein
MTTLELITIIQAAPADPPAAVLYEYQRRELDAQVDAQHATNHLADCGKRSPTGAPTDGAWARFMGVIYG